MINITMMSVARIIELICAYVFLLSLVENLFPDIEEFYKKIIIGASIRAIQVASRLVIDEFIWQYECDFNFGCNQYNYIVMVLIPYKSMIQLIANYATDVLNFLTQRSETLNIKNEIADAKLERADAKRERAEMNLRIDNSYEHIICIPEDYIGDPIISETRIVAQIDIRKEFDTFSNVSHPHQE